MASTTSTVSEQEYRELALNDYKGRRQSGAPHEVQRRREHLDGGDARFL